MKKILEFLSENFQFLVVKFSVYLNRRVFLMVYIFAFYGMPDINRLMTFTWFHESPVYNDDDLILYNSFNII